MGNVVQSKDVGPKPDAPHQTLIKQKGSSMNVPDKVKDRTLATSMIIGWFAGVTIFILTLYITMSASLATITATFFGFIFGWAAFNVLINLYKNGK